MHPAFINEMSWAMAEVYASVTDQLLINLARHFPYVQDREIHKSFEYQAQMLAQMGQVNQESIRIITRNLGNADDALRACLEKAILDAVKTEDPKLAEAARRGLLHAPAQVETTPSMMQAFKAYYKQSADKLNLVNTVMLESTQAAYAATVSDIGARIAATQRILNTATGQVISGVTAYNQAVHDAVKKMVANGLTGFVDHGGHRWSPEAYVAMDIKTTMMATGRAAVLERNAEYGNDLYQVSSHNGARPLCYPWQGKIISTSGRTGTTEDFEGNKVEIHSESEIESFKYGGGLFGVNCGHYPMCFIPGLSTLRGEPQDPEENEKAYAESQEQRRLERKLREEKRDLEVMKAQGASPETIQAQREKVRQASADIDDFCDETGRTRKRSRERAPVNATWPDKKTYDPAQFPTQERDKMRDWFKNGGMGNNVALQATQTAPAVVQSTAGQYKLSGLSGDYADTITQKFNAGNETARKAWEKLIPDGGCIADANTTGTPYHQDGKVYLNVRDDATNKRGAGCTFFHENGHAIDYYGGWLSDDAKFYAALKADYANALKATGKKTKDEQRFALSVELSKSDIAHKANGVSDIVGGLSKGKCQGWYGHSAKYWRERPDYGVQREAFAHMNEAAYLEGQREMITKYFPTAYKRFIELLEGVL